MTFSHITRCAVGDRGHRRDVLLQRSVGSSSQSIRLRERATLRVVPELSDPVGSLEVVQHHDVEPLGREAGPRANLRHIALDHQTAVVDGVDHDRERQ